MYGYDLSARYRVLVADPPWQFDDALPGATRGAVRNYQTMSLSALMAFPMPRMLDDSFLFLWYVTSMVDEARALCRSWGFTPSGAELVWVKTTSAGAFIDDPAAGLSSILPTDWRSKVTKLAFGMGRTLRNCDERCLIAKRGRPAVASRSERSVFFAPRGRHSEKPVRFYDIVERLTDGPYIELFARQQRSGWSAVGNELPLPPLEDR